jgi:adhesin/invasin
LWANQGDGTIGRANLDGSSADQSFITGAGSVFGLALTAASPQLTLSAPSITADGRSSTTATMTVADPNGNPVSGDDVTISSSGAQPVGPVTAGSAPGTYRATITSTTSAGSATITATDKSVSPSISETATLTQTPDRAGYVTVALSPGSIIADGSSMSVATATVTDQNDNPVTGDSVAFTSSGAQALGAVTAGASPGTYQATVTATTLAGSATITATDTTVAQHPSGASTLTQTAGPAARVAAALNTPSLTANGSSSTTVTATITDADGNPVSGDTVAFSSSGAQPVGPVTPGSTPGTYQATVTSTKTAGSATITATDTSVTPPITAAGTLTQSAAGALPKPPSQALLQLTGTPRTLLCRSAARPAEPPAMSGS